MTPHYADDKVTLYAGDCLDVLAELPDASVDAVVTDPPYGLGFMGHQWDQPSVTIPEKREGIPSGQRRRREPKPSGFDREGAGAKEAGRYDLSRTANESFGAWCEEWTAECLRVLKPGGHLLAFGGTRTWHRLACAVEDAGFEVRDSIAWLYGSGFPKSLDVSKAIDKAAGAERATVRVAPRAETSGTMVGSTDTRPWIEESRVRGYHEVAGPEAVTPDAARWQGWGTALKPAFEPVVVARKPLAGTVASNVLAHGTGALNIDGCRIEGEDAPEGRLRHGGGSADSPSMAGPLNPDIRPASPAGRWPANVVLDETQADAVDQQSGTLASGSRKAGTYARLGYMGSESAEFPAIDGDLGGASRFFYTAKASSNERIHINGIAHPTVKPLDLMRWLVRLVTPPGGTVLEPFAGSGTTVEACILEGFRCIAIEREADYLPLITQRIHRRRDPVAAVRATGDDRGLFDLLDEETA